MPKRESSAAPPSPAPDATDLSLHRSGAVARMLRMPVATLRVWERRYGLSQSQLTPSGQRQYSADDVRRLALIKQLTERGHAIGSLAPLDMVQLQGVASTHAQAHATSQASEHGQAKPAPPMRLLRPWRLAVIGATLATRLQHPALLRRLGRPVLLLGPFETLAQAAVALPNAEADALLFHQPQLQPGWLADCETAAPALAGLPKAVLYRFAAEPVCEALASAGTALLREPQPDAVLAQWLHSLSAQAAQATQPAADRAQTGAEPAAPRRWSDAALLDFANHAPTVACECPRHVAELLVQLSHFETYSAECENRNPADAQLHTYLRQVAAASRARFEAALEQVALHEGLLLPAAAPAGDSTAKPGARPARAGRAAPAGRSS